MTNAGFAQILELAILPCPGKRDVVVDLGNLVQRCTGIIRGKQDPIRIFQDNDGASLGDALLGILRLVLHHLLGRDVVRQGHNYFLLLRPAIMSS